ncbi:hypothetical protein ABV409_08205 [Flagellimonas sp. DF-77]
MDKQPFEERQPILTRRVYCDSNLVFAKDDDENWMPIAINWVTVGDIQHL